MRHPLVPTATLLGVLASVAVAHAQAPPSLDLRGFHPSADPEAGLYYEPARSPATLEFNTALWLSYAYQPLTLRRADGSLANALVGHQLSGDITVNMGLAERAAIGVDLPFALYQHGDALDLAAQASVGALSLPVQALGDVAMLVKVTLVTPTGGDLGGFALALHERLALPTGDPTSLIGEGHVSSETRLLAEYRFLALSAHGAVGVKFRDHHDFGCGQLPAEQDCPTRFGHELPFGMGLSFKPQAIGLDDAGRWTWFAETYGRLPLAPRLPFTSEALAQVQLAAGARVQLGADVSLLGGVEAALVGGIGTAPFRATLALAWAPRKHDDDDDGVPNDIDECPEDLPEDYDGFEDDDGCPEWDNDDDGVPDGEDKCDGEKEDEDGYQDDDGCIDADNDGDGIDDGVDACPMEKGVLSADAAKNGCPDLDIDRDGVELPADQCPAAAEDKDGFEDEDGCPDPDNDGDGINDSEDACRDEKGPQVTEHPAENGCPDRDGDGVADVKDACPDEVGVRQEDASKNGCVAEDDAEDGGKPKK